MLQDWRYLHRGGVHFWKGGGFTRRPLAIWNEWQRSSGGQPLVFGGDEFTTIVIQYMVYRQVYRLSR